MSAVLEPSWPDERRHELRGWVASADVAVALVAAAELLPPDRAAEADLLLTVLAPAPDPT